MTPPTPPFVFPTSPFAIPAPPSVFPAAPSCVVPASLFRCRAWIPLLLGGALAGLLSACSGVDLERDGETPATGDDARTAPATVRFAATIHPLAAILRELTDGRAEVVRLLPPGASPHTYDPRPSDARAAQDALALFSVDRTLDGWAARLAAERHIAVFPLLPERDRLAMGPYSCCPHDHSHGHDHHRSHENEQASPGSNPGHPADDETAAHEAPASGHVCSAECAHDHAAADHARDRADDGSRESAAPEGGWDPHFWMDPLTVKALLPDLTRALATLDPEGAAVYEANAERFAEALDALHARATQHLAPVAGSPVVLHHPSIRYLMARHSIPMLRAIEASPGKEPSPKYIHDLVTEMKQAGVKAVFIEPQLSNRPARAVAEAAGLPLETLDPVGGVPGRERYEELILFNAEALGRALR